MQKTFPAGYITREDQAHIDAGHVKGHFGWVTPEEFLIRVEAKIEEPVIYLTTHRTIMSQLCDYVCQFWNETLYTPEVSLEERRLQDQRMKQAWLQSLDGGAV